MALRAIEGFDWCASLATLGAGKKFRTIGSSSDITLTAGRLGGKCLNLARSSFGSLGVAVLFDQAVTSGTVHMGVAIRVDSLENNERALFSLGSAGYPHMTVSVNGAGYVEIREFDSNAPVATSVTHFLQLGQWYFIEVSMPVAGTGTMQVFVNNELAVAYYGNLLPNPDGPAAISEVHFGCAKSGRENTQASYDDFYALDETGSEANSRLGDSRIEWRPPTADEELDFAIEGAEVTGYESVDDATGHDGDVTAISSATTGHRAVFSSGAGLSTVPRKIHGVSILHVSRKEGADAKSQKVVLSSGATEVAGTSRSLLDTYAANDDLFAVDPNTGIEWTVGGITASKFGVEVT